MKDLFSELLVAVGCALAFAGLIALVGCAAGYLSERIVTERFAAEQARLARPIVETLPMPRPACANARCPAGCDHAGCTCGCCPK